MTIVKTTLRRMTVDKMTFSIMTLHRLKPNRMALTTIALSKMTLSKMTLSKMTLSIKTKGMGHISFTILSSFARCCSPECHFSECRGALAEPLSTCGQKKQRRKYLKNIYKLISYKNCAWNQYPNII
jgi:hypothetical protein